MVDNTVDNDFGVLNPDATFEDNQDPAPVEDVKLEDVEPLAPVEDEPKAEDEDEVDIPEEDQEESKHLNLKPKKQSARERVQEAVAKQREAERETENLRRQLEDARAAKAEQTEEKVEAKQPTGPTPDDIDEAGEPKYPLGEYDPQYIRDFTRHVLEEEFAANKAREAEEAAVRQQQEAVMAIQQNWQEKLSEAREKMPDIEEKGMRLEATFEGLDPQYGEYLAQTIMSLDNGPEVLYYLSDNIEEAKALVAAGPLKATLGLGELNSMFKAARTEPPVKVTSAPEPPADRARGSTGRFEVPDDTDDLEAFARKFYGR